MDVFYWLLNMSIIASVAGLAIMLIRLIPKMPKRLTVFLWLIPFIRMTVPWGIAGSHSIMRLLYAKTVVVSQPLPQVAFSGLNCIQAADNYFPISYKLMLWDRLFYIASLVWLVVFLVIVLLLAVFYLRTMGQLKQFRHLRDNIYCSQQPTAAAVYGIIRPKIVLSEDCDHLVLIHEQTHIRRGDNLWRLLGLITAAVHWFNPLAWVFLKLFLEDLEMACDECVLAKLGRHRAKEYALCLLEAKQQSSLLTSAFGGVKLKTRIEHILSIKRLTLFSLAVLLCFMAALFYVLLTNPG